MSLYVALKLIRVGLLAVEELGLFDSSSKSCSQSSSGPSATMSAASLEEAALLLHKNGEKIEAIKLHRANTNDGLAEAKYCMDLLAYNNGLGPKPKPLR